MTAIADDEVFDDVGGGAGVDADAAGGDFAGLAGVVAVELEDFTVFHDQGEVDDAEALCERGMLFQVTIIAVDGNEEFRPEEVDHEPLFFLAGVAADVDEAGGAIVVDDVGIAAAEVVDDAEDAFLVAGDDARTEDDGVAGGDAGVLVVVDGGAGERGHGLALGAGDEDAELVGRGVLDLVGMDDKARGWVNVAEVLGDLGGVVDGAADDGDLAAVRVGEFHGDTDAMDGRGEAAEEELFLGAGEDFVEAGFDGPFAGSVAGAIDVGGVLQEGEDATLAVFGEAVEVESFAVGRGEVDFEVAAVDDDADGSFDGEGNTVDEGVGDADGLDGECAEGEFGARGDFDELGVVEEGVFVELALDVGEGELGAVDGDVELGEDPREAADVVFVAVGEQNRPKTVPPGTQKRDVGQDHVHARGLLLREGKPGVDDQHVRTHLQQRQVLADLSQTTEGDEAQRPRRRRG